MLKNIIWCPVDVPKFPIIKIDDIGTIEYSYWKYLKLTNETINSFEISELSSSTLINYPEIENWLNHFPYKTIRNVKINFQRDIVNPHKDFNNPNQNIELYNNNADNEPCGYRVLISGKRSDSLYVMNGNHKVYTNLPETTDTYVLGHTSTIHGVEYEPNRISMFLHFEIDKYENDTLLEKSFLKYKEFAVIRDENNNQANID